MLFKGKKTGIGREWYLLLPILCYLSSMSLGRAFKTKDMERSSLVLPNKLEILKQKRDILKKHSASHHTPTGAGMPLTIYGLDQWMAASKYICQEKEPRYAYQATTDSRSGSHPRFPESRRNCADSGRSCYYRGGRFRPGGKFTEGLTDFVLKDGNLHWMVSSTTIGCSTIRSQRGDCWTPFLEIQEESRTYVSHRTIISPQGKTGSWLDKHSPSFHARSIFGPIFGPKRRKFPVHCTVNFQKRCAVTGS